MLKGKPIVVLGIHRSGTSLLTGILSRLGVYVGKPDGSLHDAGHYEVSGVMALNSFICKSFSSTVPFVEPLPQHWDEYPFAADLMEKVEMIMERHFGAADGLWGWKEPNTTMFLPIYQELLRRQSVRPRYVICVRNPASVVRSRLKFYGPANHIDHPRLAHVFPSLWLQYTLFGLVSTAGEERAVCCYEKLLQSPRGTLEPILRSLDLPVSAEDWASIETTIRQDRNHRAKDESGLDQYPRIFRDTYELCQRAAENPEELMKGIFDGEVASLWREACRLVEAFGHPRAPEACIDFKWEHKRPIQKAVGFFSTRRIQHVDVEIPAPPGEALSFKVIPGRSILWMKNFRWQSVEGAVPTEPEFPRSNQASFENCWWRIEVDSGSCPVAFVTPKTEGPWRLQMDVLLEPLRS